MAVKRYKTNTSGRRNSSVTDFSVLTRGVKPIKKLLVIKKRSGGRNFSGKITIRHRGGGAKRMIRQVDFKRLRFDDPAKVVAIEYDPNRTAFLAQIKYGNGDLSYILAPQGLKAGDTVVSSLIRQEVKTGNRFPLAVMPVGIELHDVEIMPGRGGQLSRSAGQSVQLMAVEGKYAQLKMPSGEIRLALKECLATIGQVSNPDNKHVRIGKAGRMRYLGVKPTVRGKVMNPVDHPHGGGEGKNPIGLKYPKTKWGKHALGVKTRGNKRSNRLILRRRNSGK